MAGTKRQEATFRTKLVSDQLPDPSPEGPLCWTLGTTTVPVTPGTARRRRHTRSLALTS